jgi:hypothetical protein
MWRDFKAIWIPVVNLQLDRNQQQCAELQLSPTGGDVGSLKVKYYCRDPLVFVLAYGTRQSLASRWFPQSFSRIDRCSLSYYFKTLY